MKAISLLSGGKDSFLAAMIAMEQGFDIITCITVIPEEDSPMFHVPNARHASKVAELLGLNTKFCSEDQFRGIIEDIASKNKDLALINGAIASNYQRNRLEILCTELSMLCYSPLWRVDQDTVMEEIINRNIGAIIVSVSAEGLGKDFLGREINPDTLNDLKQIRKRYGINITGEGGEYESFVTSYGSGKLSIKKSGTNFSGSTGSIVIEELELVTKS
ncbi:MAG: diphthine--ammonia ligase [Thermoplasmataceae archaeon]